MAPKPIIKGLKIELTWITKSPPRLPKYQFLGGRHQSERLYGGQVAPLCQRGTVPPFGKGRDFIKQCRYYYETIISERGTG